MVRRLLLIVTLLIFAIAAWTQETGGIAVLDGESAGTTPWEFDSLTEQGSMTFALAAGAANNGSYGYRVTGDGTNDLAYGQYSFTEESELFVRIYINIPAGFDNEANYDTSFFLAFYDGATFVCAVGLRSTEPATPDRWCLDYRFTQSYSTTDYSSGSFHYVELRYYAHASAGGAQLYVNGSSILSDLDQASSYAIDTIRIGIVSEDSVIPNGDYLDFDDIKLDTSLIGAYSAGSIIPHVDYYLRRLR